MQSALKTREPRPRRGRRRGHDGKHVRRQACSTRRRRRPENGVLGDYGAAPDFVTKGTWFNTEGLVAAASGQTAQGGSMPAHPGGAARQGRGGGLLDLQLRQLRAHAAVPEGLVRHVPGQGAGDRRRAHPGVRVREEERQRGAGHPATSASPGPWCRTTTTRSGTPTPTSTGRRTTSSTRRAGCATSTSARASTTSRRRSSRSCSRRRGRAWAASCRSPRPQLDAQTPETYLGYDRGRGFATAVHPVADKPADYRPARLPGNGEWNLDGQVDHHAAVRRARIHGHAAARLRRKERVPRDRAAGAAAEASRVSWTARPARTPRT